MNHTFAASVVRSCAICHKPAPLETAKTDERGRIIHEECYLSKMRLVAASMNAKRSATTSGKNM
jgi:hypothetical protein